MLTIHIRGTMTDSQQQQTDTPESHFLPCHGSPSNLVCTHGRGRHASGPLYLGGRTVFTSAQAALLAKSFRNKTDRYLTPSVCNFTVFWSQRQLGSAGGEPTVFGKGNLHPGLPQMAPFTPIVLTQLLIGNPSSFTFESDPVWMIK